MLCLRVENIPEELCVIDDECKAIYHSRDTMCVWVFDNRKDRNAFVDATVGMMKDERVAYYQAHYADNGMIQAE